MQEKKLRRQNSPENAVSSAWEHVRESVPAGCRTFLWVCQVKFAAVEKGRPRRKCAKKTLLQRDPVYDVPVWQGAAERNAAGPSS